MASFSVVPLSVMQAGAQIGPIEGQVLDTHGAISGTSGAADGTPGAEAFEGLLSHWASVLPQFAASSAGLAGALSGSGMAYALVDSEIGDSCEVLGS